MGSNTLRWRATAGFFVILLFVSAAVAWSLTRPPTAHMTASSAQSEHEPELALAGKGGSWRSKDETVGAWLQRSWETPVEVRRVVLDAGSEGGATAGYLRFSDGSQVSVMLGTGETVIPISPRRASWVRFTVTAAEQGARTVGLAEFEAGDEDEGQPDVEADGPPDGDVAPLATVTGVRGDADALVDADADTSAPVNDTISLTWDRPRELTHVSIAGAATGSTVDSGRLEFSDGSVVPVGAVTSDPERPTTVAFMPRTSTSLQFVVDSATGSGDLLLSSLSAHQRGGEPVRPLGADPSAAPANPEPAACAPSGPRPDPTSIVIRCPTNDTVIDGSVDLQVAAGTAYSAVSAVPWGDGDGGPRPAQSALDTDGEADLVVDVSRLGPGPFFVAVTATGPRVPPRTSHLQLVTPGEPAASADPVPEGRTPVFEDQFNEPLSVSRTGEDADYVAGKPEHWGVTDFGAAIFADPTLGLGNAVQRDGLLRLSVTPKPAELDDPQGWDRDHVGGMVASARPGGSGFSAQYGYFEARMLSPAEPGTWPAFWLLTNPNLVREQPVVAEIDTVELYGHDPDSACHSSHQYPDPHGVGEALCGQRWQSSREALGWHTYGVDVRPDRIRYFIDGELVGEAEQVGAAGEPMFFMVDLALGGGWPIDLSAVRDQATLYVDWVRVFV